MLLAVLVAVGVSQPTQAQNTDDRLTSEEISAAVSDELLADTGVSGYQVNVDTENGIVTLSGRANNILAKQRAARIAESVKGVRSVVNNITLPPQGRSDGEIAEDVVEALAADPATESWEINIDVNDGRVTLSGDVDSWQQKQLAARVAKGVRGVSGARNNLDVDYATYRNAAEIETEIEAALRWDTLIDHALVDVEVSGDEVILSGTVGSAAEKTRAITKAYVRGVRNVDATGLDVESWARDQRFRKDKYVEKPDQKIAAAIEDALVYHPRVSSFNIGVDVDAGVATLTGTVDNVKAKRAAGQTARHTVGVWRVKNKINVRSPEQPSDPMLENRVENALERDPYVNRYEIDVDVVNGQAYLTGDVDSVFERAQADDAAAEVEGVVHVNNNLDVDADPDPLIYDPYVDEDWYTYDFDWYTYPDNTVTAESDWEIQEEINDELFWSPFVDSDEVTVTVDNGVATLTGTVDTWDEFSAATENAYEGGAIAVDNDLFVQYGPEYYQE
jgi:osmotically-inducible protein OsmY